MLRKLFFICLLTGILLPGCDQGGSDAIEHKPVAFASGDECHLCGMIITRFPGPKGEAFVRRTSRAHKFCSTRDLFAWMLQPDVTSRVESVYVHDMGQSPWDSPDDSAMIDAREAWYVIGSDRKGAMGHTLAPFSDKKAATRFSSDYGGRVVSFGDIDLDMLQSM